LLQEEVASVDRVRATDKAGVGEVAQSLEDLSAKQAQPPLV
jgi:hypothetical protein